jgi:hypothetical protein
MSKAPLEGISVEFDIGDFVKICRENPDLVNVGKKC